MAEGFKVADAFVEVGVKDETGPGLSKIKGSVAAGLASLGAGAIISKGIMDGLDIRAGNAKLQGQLGLTKDVAAQAGKLSGEVYRDGFGGSMEEVNTAIAAVGTNLVDLGRTSPGEVKKLTEAAMGIATTFNVDVNEATRAAGQLVKNGMAPDFSSAFDTITKGYQSGLNVAGDFSDTLNEYSPQFSKLGIDGPHALALLSAGLKAGARDTDVIADAFKEFSLRSIDGSKLTAEGFKAAGLDAKVMAAEIAKGGPAAQKATMTTLQALLKIKDPVKQNAAGVALFGTQWEDTLRQILPAIAGTTGAMEGVKGSTDAMNAAVAAGANPVDAMKRRMEGWLQTAVNLPGPLGATSSGVAAMGTQGIIAAGALAQLGPSLSGIIGPAAKSAGSVVSAGAKMAASGVASAASMAASAAVHVAKWVWLGIQSTISAVRIAAAWVLAMGPISWITVAVIALVVLIVAKWDWVSVKGKAIWGAFWGWLSGLWNSIYSGTVNKWNGFKSFLSGIPGAIVGVFMRWTLLGIIISHWSQIVSGVKGKGGQMVSYVRGIPGMITGALGNLGSLLWNAGSSVIQGLINGIKFKIGEVKNTLSSVTNLIPDWKGPMDRDRELLTPNGRAIMGGLVRGLKDGTGEVKDTLQGVTGAIPEMYAGGPGAAAGAPGTPSTGGTTNHYSIGTVELRAEDLKELETIVDFFERITQDARSLAPAGVRRG